MRFLIATFFIFFSMTLFSQGLFKLTGEIKNPTERKVLITIYRDWVGDEEEYEVKLDKYNQFCFDINLNDVAYIDFYYAEFGFHYWIIEPNDQIYLKINTKDFWHTLSPSGAGSKKWVYYLNDYHVNEEKRDIQQELDKWREFPVEDFFKNIDNEQTKQLALLDNYRNTVSDKFYELRRADIIGSLQNHKVEHLYSDSFKSWSETLIKSKLQFENLLANSQSLSLEFGNTYLNLIELFITRASESRKSELSVTDSYNLIKSLFIREYIGKELVDRLLANYLKNTIELGGINEEIRTIVNDYSEFSENRNYKNYLLQRVGFLNTLTKGSPAKPFFLKDIDGKEVSLETLKGKVVYLDFWASWCGPCIQDMKYMETVKERFKNFEDLAFVYVSLDTEEEWQEAIKQNKVAGLNLRADENSEIVRNYGVRGIPAYFLIDRFGNFAVSQVADPSLEEGKALIKQIEEALK